MSPDIATQDAFWIVWREDGASPTRKHKTRHSAEQEARRLALLTPGKRFIVLYTETAFEVADPIKRIDYAMEIPF